MSGKMTFEQAVVESAKLMDRTVDSVLQFYLDEVSIYMKEING